jgi:uncharacterized protein
LVTPHIKRSSTGVVPMSDDGESVIRLDDILSKIPGAEKFRAELNQLKKLLKDQRPPRFVLVGRRGSGKSSLVNAIFGQEVAQVGHTKAQTGRGRWWTYEGNLGAIEILDTRGLQEGSNPDSEDGENSPLESIVTSIGDRLPDAVLFLVKAKEVDAAIDADVSALVSIRRRLDEEHLPIVAVITHIDELEPKNARLHDVDNEDPGDVQEKLTHVAKVQRQLDDKICQHPELKKDLVAVIGVSTYMSWRRDGSLRADERWHIDELIAYLATELPDEAQVEFARLSRITKVQRKIAMRLTTLVSTVCAGVGATPIPGVDIPIITGLQLSLVSGIAYVSGREMSLKTASEFLAAVGMNVGVGYGMRQLTRALAKVVAPGAGHAVSGAMAGAATYAIGKAAVLYFIDGKGPAEAKAFFEKQLTIKGSAGEQMLDTN